MKNSKILFVIASLNPATGGPVEALRKLVEYYRINGITADILSLDAPDAVWLQNDAYPVYAIGPSLGAYAFNNRLIQWLQQHHTNYDYIVVRGVWQYIGLAVWWVASKTNKPYFVFPHGMLDPWFKHYYPLKHLKKYFYWLMFEHRILRSASAVIFTSDDEKLAARLSFQPYQCKEVVTCYGTAEPPALSSDLMTQFYNQYPELLNKKILLFLSRIHEKKGCDLLIQAFAEICPTNTDIHLLMVGPDQNNMLDHLQKLAITLGIQDRITWIDMVQGDLKWTIYYAANAFILPSHQENFGIVVAEALACGKPVLITDKVNIWREIHADQVGFVDEDSVSGVVSMINQWLQMSEDEYTQMSARAVACFQSNFHIRAAADSLLTILHSEQSQQVEKD